MGGGGTWRRTPSVPTTSSMLCSSATVTTAAFSVSGHCAAPRISHSPAQGFAWNGTGRGKRRGGEHRIVDGHAEALANGLPHLPGPATAEKGC